MLVDFYMRDFTKEIHVFGEQAAGIDLKFLRDDVLESIMIMFNTEGHGTWEPLAQGTIRKKRNPGAPILQDTGAMKSSVFGEYSSDEVVIYVGTPYARFHITGTKNMPKRDFSDVNIEEIISYATGQIAEEISG